jgi:hypothetical protein
MGRKQSTNITLFANAFFDLFCIVEDGRGVKGPSPLEQLEAKFAYFEDNPHPGRKFADYTFPASFGDGFEDLLMAVARKVYTLIPLIAFNQDRELVYIIVSFYSQMHSRRRTSAAAETEPTPPAAPTSTPEEPPKTEADAQVDVAPAADPKSTMKLEKPEEDEDMEKIYLELDNDMQLEDEVDG